MSDTETKRADAKTYDERIKAVNAISKPLASRKSTKKAHKLVKKASTAKIVRRGVKEVVKGIRKQEKGICILAGVSRSCIEFPTTYFHPLLRTGPTGTFIYIF